MLVSALVGSRIFTRQSLVFASGFAALVFIARLSIYALSPLAWDPAYVLGLCVAMAGNFSLGWLVFACTRWPLRGLVRSSLAACALLPLSLLEIFAGHYHTFFARAAGRGVLAALWGIDSLAISIEGHVPWWLWSAELAVMTSLLLALHAILCGANDALPQRLRLVFSAAILVGFLALFVPFGLHGQLYHGSVHPLAGLLHQPRHLEVPKGLPTAPSRDEVALAPIPEIVKHARQLVQTHLRPASAGAAPHAHLPFCRSKDTSPTTSAPSQGRPDIILLVLESVGQRELMLDHQGSSVMPNLRAFAQRGLSFRHFFAAGDTSAQALVSMLSGIPPATHRRLLRHAPLRKLAGLPHDLHRLGYESGYFHGSDLSFEQQRSYLQHVGFHQIIEHDLLRDERVGWGTPDGKMFTKLQRWMDRARSAPRFATLFTLSTHDPYALPEDIEPLLPKAKTAYQRYLNASHYLDQELGKFLRWFDARRRPTVLLITGDHAPRTSKSGALEPSTGALAVHLRMPLIISASKEAAFTAPERVTERTGGHLDLPQTILGLAGWPARMGCYQGRDLLAESWPAKRKVISLAGEDLRFFFVSEKSSRWLLNLAEGRAALHDTIEDPHLRRDRSASRPREHASISQLARAYATLGYFLNFHDRYAPAREKPSALAPPAASAQRGESTSASKIIVVAHRGNTLGVAGDRVRENTLAALERAVKSGVKWVEVDLQITRDRHVVLFHDSVAQKARGKPVPVADLTLARLRRFPGAADTPTLAQALQRFGKQLNFCLELKSQRDTFDQMVLLEKTLRQIDALPPSTRVIVDSFSRVMASTVKHHSRFEAAYDFPLKPVKPYWIDYAASAGFDWVYIHARFATAAVLRAAHERGLKVMVYAADSPSLLKRWKKDLPDGLMSDYPTRLLGRVEASKTN